MVHPSRNLKSTPEQGRTNGRYARSGALALAITANLEVSGLDYAGRMARKKIVVGPDDATGGGMLQKAAKAIGSVVGTLAATAGIAHAEEPPKMTGKAKRTAPKAVSPAVKKRAKKAAAKKNPAVKRDRVRKT
jgi:hypothetical protein